MTTIVRGLLKLNWRSFQRLRASGLRRRTATIPADLESLERRALLSSGSATQSTFLSPRLARSAAVDVFVAERAARENALRARADGLANADPILGQRLTKLAQAREMQAAQTQDPASPRRFGVAVQRDIVYRNDGGHAVTLDLYRPVGPVPPGGWPAIVAFPGGGWRWASKKDYGQQVGGLASFGYVVAVADYTYGSATPGTKVWPVDFEDVRDAVRWVRGTADWIGVDPNRIAAMGVSSGAYMANMLGTYPDGPVSAEQLPPNPTAAGAPDGVSARVQAVVDFYGPTDMPLLWQEAVRTRPNINTFLGGTPDQFPGRYLAASPDQFVSHDDPPFLIFQGSNDPTVPPDQSQLLAAKLQNAGVPYRLMMLQGYAHGFPINMPALNLTPDVLTFLDEALNGKPITG